MPNNNPEESKRQATRRRFHLLNRWITGKGLASTLAKKLTDGQVTGLVDEFNHAVRRGGERSAEDINRSLYEE